MSNSKIAVEYNSGFFAAKSFASIVRNRLSREALNPEKTIDFFITVKFKGVDGYVHIDIMNKRDWSYMQNSNEFYSPALVRGKCKPKHAKAALEYVFGKKFQAQLNRSIAACHGGYHTYAA